MKQITNATKLISKIFCTLMLLTTNSYAMEDKASTKTSNQITKESNQITSEDNLDQGRDFSVLSFNADGSELMFNECFYYQDELNQKKKYPEGECKIFRLNLVTNELRHYDLPEQDKYTYSDGSFSPRGDYVVMKRAPKNKYNEKLSDKENAELARQNYEQAEIALMRADGTDFKIIKMEAGLKARPVMSNDESKIAYVRSKSRPQGSKTYSSNFDIWEIDLKNRTDKIFAGPYQFFETGQMQYLKGDDKLLLHAYGPRKYAKEISEYIRRFNNSAIYTIGRGEVEPQEPMVVSGISNLKNPFLSTNENILFWGVEDKAGTRLFRKSHSGDLEQWRPVGKFIYVTQILAAQDEKKIFFIYLFNKKSLDLSKSGIAFLDTVASEWRDLSIPKASSSKSISVIGFSAIEAYRYIFLNNSLKKLPRFSLTNPIKNK